MKKFAGSAVLFLSLSAVMALAPLSFGQDLPAGAGRETLKKVCTQCHDIESVPRLRYSKADWTSLVYSMKDMGADATSAELDEIIDYLSTNFGKADPDAVKKVNVNTATSQDMATGLGITAKDSDLIVQYRAKNGNFKDLDSLLKVDGIDTAKVQAAKDKLAF
jgi:competence ComEA-like helix-hairpin-helix protein